MKSCARIITAFLFSAALLGCHSAEQRRQEQHRQESLKLSREVADFGSHYNAVTDWPQQLKNVTYTINVEPIFLRADHRPALFYATLEDVRRQNDVVFLYFLTTPTEAEPVLRLVLECSGCDLQTLQNPAHAIGDFVVIAQIGTVVKSLDPSVDAPEYILNGKLIEAQFVGDYALDKALAQQK